MERNKFSGNLSLYGLGGLLQSLCQSIRKKREYTGEGPLNEEQQELCSRVEELVSDIIQKYSYPEQPDVKAQALLALMDAYEILGKEDILKFALAQAEALLSVLPSSPLKCKLLSYCYYYVEEAECAKEASRIIAGWDKSCYTPEMTEAVECYFSLVDFA
mgnify:CR=1 FL=1